MCASDAAALVPGRLLGCLAPSEDTIPVCTLPAMRASLIQPTCLARSLFARLFE